MNPIPASGPRCETDATRPADAADQVFFNLQLRIARRADELAKTVPLLRDHSLECWLWAEQAIMAEALGPGLPTTRL